MNNVNRAFDKVLIANRGEIAVRVIKTANAMGFKTVAVYSELDVNSPHVKLANESVCIGAPTVSESYLNIDKIIDAAKRSGANAIHPGYGFLSENAEFADACEKNNILFIGPSSDVIKLMGSKRLSKIAIREANVPCIEGYDGEGQDDDTLSAEAGKIGYPIMIKASAGGGGRGMRLVTEGINLSAELKTARSEALNAFGDGELILEKAVIEPRHIEIQIFADSDGDTVYLGERDCSIQRRHQKVVEECPSPFVDDELRKKMGEAAVSVAKSCGYEGAGTVEFLVDKDKNFYFLEMNTRLQVEHPVTEIVYNVDLVEWQLNVAQGQPLPLSQDELQPSGHAIEVRLYAEDTAKDFIPQTGDIHLWVEDTDPYTRTDAGISTGGTVSPYYDPMLAKIIAKGNNREEARRRLSNSLQKTVLLGVKSNQTYLSNIIEHPAFISGAATTAFINNETVETDHATLENLKNTAGRLAAFLFSFNEQGQLSVSTKPFWSNSASVPVTCKLTDDYGEARTISLEVTTHSSQSNGGFTINSPLEKEQPLLSVIEASSEQLTYISDGVSRKCQFYIHHNTIFLKLGAHNFSFTDDTFAPPDKSGSAGSGVILAPMDGLIVDILTSLDSTVTNGETIIVLEAMKMEHQLKANVDGTLGAINVKVGDQVKIRDTLAIVTSTCDNDNNDSAAKDSTSSDTDSTQSRSDKEKINA